MDLLSLNWLWRFIILLVPATILWGAELVRIYIGFYTGEFTDWTFVEITYFALVIFIYVVSYQAFRRNDLFELSHDDSVPVHLESESTAQVDDHLQSTLTNIMVDDRLYLKNDLTINDVASAVNSSPKKVSVCVNKAFDSNFSEWVNRYRVEEVKQRIDSGAHENLTIEAIGQDSGFKSRSAMYAAFKKFTGESPASLRKPQ
jgi:AraC-like DNA-binding protein